jgi:ubiquinone biosynthesis monooxygenase Coq7
LSWLDLPAPLKRDLRSNHAGEAGDIAIYKGVFFASRNAHVRNFAQRDLRTQTRHFAIFQKLIPASGRSCLLPLWRVAGWLTGFLPGLVGPKPVYQTIAAVESFFESHYQRQIAFLEKLDEFEGLKNLLVELCADEVKHKFEASALVREVSIVAKSWCWTIKRGSAIAVVFASRV